MELNNESCVYTKLNQKRVFYDENDKKFYLNDEKILNFNRPILFSLTKTSDVTIQNFEKSLEKKLLEKYKH